MTFESSQLRRIMGCFATGVTVVTTCFDDGDYWAITANSITSVSLDPPLILVSVGKGSAMCACLAKGMCYAVNILTIDQEDVSRRFASRNPKDLDGLALDFSRTGAPILRDSLAYMDCKVVQTVPAGDHDILIGEVVAGSIKGGLPLLFYNGRSHSGSRLIQHQN
jgi:flavin reductase (DIM6/NTAB) family NADH-FMN oxidoreductase RutF